MPFTVCLPCSQMPKEQAKSRSKWWQSFTDVCAACVNPRDAEVRTGAEEDGQRGLAIYKKGGFLAPVRFERFVCNRQEVPQKWAYCWISRNLAKGGGWVRAGNVSLALTASCTHFCYQHRQHLPCKPSLPVLCDDVTFFSPQGWCWGLESPAGHPWHPSFPLPFIPWWGNHYLGVVGVARGMKPSPTTYFAPWPLHFDWSALANSPSHCLEKAWSHLLPSLPSADTTCPRIAYQTISCHQLYTN